MADTQRTRARARTLADITRIGREHLATEGGAALSVRAVARDAGMVSSAIYRYVSSRDDLLTLLVVDGYDELGEVVDKALSKVPASSYRSRFMVIGRAVRTWARREPATYALLFGSPVPGYEAPGEQTTGPGTRVIGALVRVYAEAHAAGAATVPPFPGAISKKLRRDFDGVRGLFGSDAPDELVARGVLAWAGLFGCVSFELFGQYGPDTFTASADLFDHQLGVLADTLGLEDL